MLIWEIDVLKTHGENQELEFSRSYTNGRSQEHEITMEKLMFLNYVALFPAKDIVRIRLGLQGHYLYNFYYIDKSHIDEGYLGVMGTAEYGEVNPFDWPESELIAKFVFAEYMKRKMDGRLTEEKHKEEFIQWLDDKVLEYYHQYLEEKEKFQKNKAEKTKESLLNAFNSFAEPQSSSSSTIKKKRSKLKEKRTNKVKNQIPLREIEPQPEIKIEKLPLDKVKRKNKHKNKDKDKEKEKINIPEYKNPEIYDRKFEFMFINGFGNPLTKIMAFLNGQQIDWGTHEEQDMQSLEGMTYSVLKSFVEQQNLNLDYMQIRKPDKSGFQFILFRQLKIGQISYLIIMNVDNFNKKLGKSIGILLGDEELILNRCANELLEHEEWFNEKGEFKSRKIAFEVESVFYRQCKRAFQ